MKGSFRRSLLGYRPSEVDAEIAARNEALAASERARAEWQGKVSELESATERLSQAVVARDHELRRLRDEIASLRVPEEPETGTFPLPRQIEELRAQARGQATQIRMRALRDAAELVQRVSEAAKLPDAAGKLLEALDGSGMEASLSGPESNGRAPDGVFEGTVSVDVGPLTDFSQLVELEDAAGSIHGTSEISIKRFSKGRATLDVKLDEPVALLDELEQRCDLEFKVRSRREDGVVLDVDDPAPE
jgi:hypothetical protein